MRKQTLWQLAGIGAFGFALAAGPAAGQTQKMEQPKYGGTLEIVTVYATISALSWDNYDYNWKHNHDTGQVYEQLFATDLSQAKSRGGKSTMTPDAYIPTELLRGELAEKWELKENPLQIVITLRKGVMFPEKPGVMASRELTSEDIVYTFNRQNSSPKKVDSMYDYVDSVRAADKYTVVFNLKEFNAEWAYRFGYGYYSGIVPKEVVDAGATNWKNINGTGPFRLTEYTQGNSNVYEKNPVYWGTETINEKEFKLPYVDKLIYRLIKDEATRVTGLRTGKIDVLELVRWQDAETAAEEHAGPEMEPVARDQRHVPGDARRHQAVRRHPRAPRAEHGGEQGRDHQGLLQRPRGTVRLSAASDLWQLLHAAGEAAGERQGAVQVRPGQGEEASGGSRLSERLHLQDPGLLVQLRTTRICCRWWPAISSRSASRWRSCRWSMRRSCRR